MYHDDEGSLQLTDECACIELGVVEHSHFTRFRGLGLCEPLYQPAKTIVEADSPVLRYNQARNFDCVSTLVSNSLLSAFVGPAGRL